MENIFNYINGLMSIACSILALYLFVSLFLSNGYDMAKKWFKNIVIVSHVDLIKEIADNIVEITKKGMNASVKA